MRRLALTVVLLLAGCEKAPPTQVTVADAPGTARDQRVVLTDGKVLLDKGGVYERICLRRTHQSRGQSGCSNHYFYVFPLVPKAWKAGEPVPAWVTCSKVKSVEACRQRAAAIDGAVEGVVAVREGDEHASMRTRSGWEKAVRDARDRHGLTSTAQAPVVRLTSN